MSEELREQIAEIIYNRDSFAGDDPWSRVHPVERERCRRGADAVLALPAVRDALAAQEAVKRVSRLADMFGSQDYEEWHGDEIAASIRREIAGDS